MGPQRQVTSPHLKSVRSYNRSEKAWRVIRENARTSKSLDVQRCVDLFSEEASKNLRSLSSKLSAGTFKFPPAKGVPIAKIGPDGKKSERFRPIVLATVESRIIQRSILDVLLGIPALKPYFENPYSFGGIRKWNDDLSAVPAAIHSILENIGNGSKFIEISDIRSFFTRISKDAVTKIVFDVTQDKDFTKFFRNAINVELSNPAELKQKAKDFPIHEIGVAQGNSLSPLLGNMILHEFDRHLNAGDCRCLRYIDDFIILAPTAKAAAARMKLAVKILGNLGMELSPEKSSKLPRLVSESFDF